MKRLLSPSRLMAMVVCAGIPVASPAFAALSDFNVCPALANEVQIEAGRVVPDVCYTGFNCTAGLRGAWLDLTDEVQLTGTSPVYPVGPVPRASIAEKGADIRARTSCVPPSNLSREGYVAVRLEDIVTPGNYKLTVERVGNAGFNRHRDSLPLEIRNGGNFLNLLATAGQPYTARAGQVRELDMGGRGLQQLRVKAGATQPFTPPGSRVPSASAGGAGRLANRADLLRSPTAVSSLPAGAVVVTRIVPPFEIVSARFDSVRIRVNVQGAGTVNLEDYFEFVSTVPGAIVTPSINNDLGWPRIEVRP